MRALTLLTGLLLSLALSACGGGGEPAPPPGGSNLLTLLSWATGDDSLTLNLRGPQAGDAIVTFYIFGSHESLGDNAMVPLQAQRMDEQAIATLAAGDVLDNVDLSAWDAYEFVYLRALSVSPNRIHLLQPGNIYQFGVL